MSNVARRQRRTVPLCSSSHHADGGDFSVPTTDESSMPTTSTVSGTSTGSSESTGNSRTYQIKSDVSVSTRRLEPIRQSFLNDRSGNARGGLMQPSPGISTSELRRSIEERLSAAKDNAIDPYTTPRSSRLQKSARDLTSFISLEQVLESSQDQFSGSFSRPSFTVRTPFEVDAPRGETPKHRSSRLVLGQRSQSPSGRSVVSDTTNPNLSKEQDAWAGIDALLETRSMDDSFCYSTSEILPKATVKALRRETKGGLRELDEETVWGDEESEAGESRMSKRSLESISKSSSTSSNSSRRKGHTTPRKSKTESESDGNQHSWNSREGRRERRNSPGVGEAGLFDVFQWSDKDNVDAERIRKGKLNSKPRKTINLPVPAVTKESQQDSDTSSLPSLATYRADDFSIKSGAQSVGTYQSRDYGSVVTENSRDEFGDESLYRDFNHNIIRDSNGPTEHGSSIESHSYATPKISRNSLAGDGLVLDKSVDEYIRKIQKVLPTIAEDEDGSAVQKGKKKKHVFFAIQDEESSPSPTSVMAEGTAFDELPSIVDLSSQKFDQSPSTSIKKQGRKGEKKDQVKPSLTFLMSSIKKMTTKPKSNKYLGDEEKYFPEAVRVGDKAKKYKDNRCLLNEGDDGVNWDTD